MLRHTCGYALANAAHDTRRIQDWLGHRLIQHTTRYTQSERGAVQGLLEMMTGSFPRIQSGAVLKPGWVFANRLANCGVLPIALWVPPHHASAAADHEPGGGLLGDRTFERGASQFERAADGQRFFALHASGLGG
jgi:hypothetical protein